MTAENILPPAHHVMAGIEKVRAFYEVQPTLIGEGIQTVLDVGCGEGRHTGILADLGFHVVGIDTSPEAIHKAQANDYERVPMEIFAMR